MPLPTKTDAVFVRPGSIRVPVGKTEHRHLRTEKSKTFEEPDGKLTLITTLGAVCYKDDNGELRSIDTTIRDLDGKIGIEWAPYKFTLHETGIGFTFESRQGGWCGVHLIQVGDMQIDGDAVYASEIVDNVITFKNVAAGCDIVFKCLNDRVKTLRILHDEKAPRTFEWMTQDDILHGRDLIVNELVGTDADGKSLALTCEATQIDRASFRVTETWNGETQDKTPVVYPVEIDPTVTINPAAIADDGYEYTVGNWDNTVIAMGYVAGATQLYHPGIRFPNVTVPQGATVSAATLGLYASSISADSGTGTIYCRAVDNSGQFGTGANLPSAVSKTTASVAMGPDMSTGAKTWNITAPVQEVINRAGFASGNAIGVPIIATATGDGYRMFSDYAVGSNIPYLEITYTVPAGSEPSKQLTIPTSLLCM